MRNLLSFPLLLSISFSLAAQPFIGPERPISPYGEGMVPRLMGKSRAVIAGNGTGFLAAWTETTDKSRIIGAQLSRDLQLVSAPAVLAAGVGSQVDLEWAGSRYVMTTVQTDESFNKTYKNFEITPKGAEEIPMNALVNASGEHLVQGWESGVFTVGFVGSDGVLHGPPVRSSEILQGTNILHADVQGDDWLLLADYYGKLYWLHVSRQRIDSRVVVPWSTPNNGSPQRVYSRVAVNGSMAAVAWGDVRPDPSVAWEYRRSLGYTVVNMQDGSTFERTVDTTSMRVEQYQSIPSPQGSAAMFNGREFVYAWTWHDGAGAGELRVAYGDAAPRVLDRFPNAYRFDAQPVLASDGSRDVLLWHPRANELVVNVVGRVLTPSSSADDGNGHTIISMGVPMQSKAGAVSTDRSTLTTWTEGQPEALMGRFVLPNGTGAPFRMIDGGTNFSTSATATAFAALWEVRNGRERRILLRRYDENGVPVDAQPIEVAVNEYASNGRLVSDGKDFVVIWRDLSWETLDYGSYAVRIPSRGAVKTAPVRIGRDLLSVTSAGGRIYILWSEYLDSTGNLLKGARLREDLKPEPTVNLWLILASSNTGTGYSYTIEGGDKEIMILLVGQLLHENRPCPRLRRFGLDLYPRGEETMLDCSVSTAGNTPVVRAKWTEEQWWLLTSGRSQKTQLEQSPFQLWRLDANGKPYDPRTVMEQQLRTAQLARTPLGLMLTYIRPDDNAAGIYRAFERSIVLQPLPKGRAARH